MKKIVIILAIIVGLMSLSFANPADFDLVDIRTGFKTYVKKDGTISVVVVDTSKAIIKLGIGSEGAVNSSGYRTFKRISIKNHFDNNDNGSLYMAINGQFFGWSTYTPLSFGTKVESDILQNQILEQEKGKRLFSTLSNSLPIVYKGTGSKYSVQKQIQDLINNDAITEAIVGIDPFDPASIAFSGPSYSKGRSMIGCLPYSGYDKSYIGLCKKVYFFTAKSSSLYSIIDEVKSWGIRDDYIIMGDGSGSAQAFSRNFEYNNRDFIMYGDGRAIPNSILLYSK